MTHRLWINNTWMISLGGGVSKVINPTTEEVIAEVTDASAEDVDRAVQAAQGAFPGWRQAPPASRSLALWKLADLVANRQAELAKVESENTGKPYEFLSLNSDLPFAIDNLRFFAAAARDTHGNRAGDYASGFTSLLRRDPVGVVGQITPWNYPLMMAVWKIAPALAAGCTVVLKPAPTTPPHHPDAGRVDRRSRDPPWGCQYYHWGESHRTSPGGASWDPHGQPHGIHSHGQTDHAYRRRHLKAGSFRVGWQSSFYGF